MCVNYNAHLRYLYKTVHSCWALVCLCDAKGILSLQTSVYGFDKFIHKKACNASLQQHCFSRAESQKVRKAF